MAGNADESAPTKFKWEINRFSKITEKKLYSNTFIAENCKWCLLIFPKGNNVDYLSLYLAVPDSTNLPNGWSRDVKFVLSVINPFKSTATVRKETTHTFNGKEVDWGFTSFIPLSKIRDPQEKYLVNDTLTVEAEVVVRKVVHYSIPLQEPKEEISKIDSKKPEEVLIPPLEKQKQVVETDAKVIEKKTEGQEIIKALPPPPTPQNLPKDPSKPKQSFQNVQTKSKDILAALSTRTTTEKSPPSNDLSQQTEALEGFFNMSLEAIQQANAFGNIEAIIQTLIRDTKDLQKKTVLEDLSSRLQEFKETIPNANNNIQLAQDRRKSLTEKTTNLDLRLSEMQKEVSLLEDKLSKVTNEEEKIEAEIQRLLAEKERVGVQKNSVGFQLEKANEKATKQLEEWRILEKEMKEANGEWLGAKEKLALANVRWKLFKEDLGLGKP